MKILIDGDGCPVIPESVELAKKYGVECVIFCNTAHNINYPGVKTVLVSKGPDTADFALVNRAEKGDVVITQDFGLAAMALAKQAVPINQNGMIYTESNIDRLLLTRHINKEARAQRVKFPTQKKRTSQQDKVFYTALDQLLNSLLNN